MAVAVGGAVTVTTRGARLLSVPRRLAAIKTSSFVTRTSSSSKLGFCPVRLRNNEVARKKLFIIRAARTESQGVSLGFRAPDFEPQAYPKENVIRVGDIGSVFRVMFICNHCPFVKLLKKDIVKLSNFYMKKGLAVVAISSNSVVTHPQDGPQFMAEEAKLYKYPFPYLYDETQDVARDFGAVCTPEFFLFKKDGRRPFELVYHGQFDDSRPSNDVPVTGRDLSLAIDSVLSGQPVSSIQKPRRFHRPTGSLLWMPECTWDMRRFKV
ncbi:Alkyl hydroperoxide reductase subunit C/ Thiol specific antioxidant [Corchorus capsularis]|uniref:Alkyl hydroperoxide reductase subunit C/ Thiol specific antioxidant n=1 Tax=Corchorus capsularis TaxID=210143 RepID=A0A1R3IZZ6_COCAP|nr:Alkyl hydroperoxide reductase subunit C/ Thiol specific antioxidant [Corchorus capsularis]